MDAAARIERRLAAIMSTDVDGMTDEITSKLTRFRNLHVIAHDNVSV